MGFTLGGAFESARKGIVKGIGSGLTGAANLTEDLLDLENPDGVQSKLAQKNLKNSLKSDRSEEGSLTIAGKSTNGINVDNTAGGDSGFYTDSNETHSYEVDGKTVQIEGNRPYSLFNKYSLIDVKDGPVHSHDKKYFNKIDPNTLANPTATKIIEKTNGVDKNYGYRYAYGDFALAKYFGRIPNNMMITLRRFAFPTPDDIISPEGPNKSGPQPDIARAITWIGEAPGNNLSDILNFSHGYNWKEAEANVQTLQSKRGDRSGTVGSLINGNKILNAAASAASGQDAYDQATRNANAGYDAFSETYPNHVFGPLNVIKDVLVREQGLNFTQEFTLKFEYELRDLGGANPKILMLDQLSNMLALTFNNAPFWGGDVRYVGDGSVGKPLGEIEKLRSGDYMGFMKSVVNDLTGKEGGSAMGNITESIKDFVSEGGVGKTLNNLLGGSLLKMFNSPQGGQAVNSLLTGDPTGQWHVTIGNPLNPIAVIGNLACTDTKINFEGSMGVQDFPDKMVVEVTLKPARPRDKSEIESMFNSGRGRFYIQPADAADINQTYNVSAYGNSDKKEANNIIKKVANG